MIGELLTAVPAIYGMLQGRPKAPKYVPMGPDRSEYINQILADANDPRSEIWRLASERANAEMSAMLGRTGLAGGSSLGQQASMNMNTELAAKWLENSLQRRRDAMQTATSYDSMRSGIAQQMYQSDMDRYKDANDRQSSTIGGIASLIGSGLGYHQKNRELADAEKRTDLYRQIASGYTPQSFGGGVGHYSTPVAPVAAPPSSGYQMGAPTSYPSYLGNYTFDNPFR